MNVLLHELRKIFNWKIVLIIATLSFIMYQLFLSFHITHFPNGRPDLDIYRVTTKMIEDYGHTLEDEEYLDFKGIYNERVKEADQLLQGREDFKNTGIKTYEEFSSIDIETNENIKKLSDKIMFEEKVDLFWELQAREYLIENIDFSMESETLGINPINQAQLEQIKELKESGTMKSIFPTNIFDNYNQLIVNETTLILLSIMVMTTPIFLRDKRKKLEYLQYTSKIGRSLFNKKLVASLLASFIIISVQLIIFFTIYSQNNTNMFFSSKINSNMNFYEYWMNITFGQYIILTVLAIYVLGLMTTLIVAYLSRVTPNYITVIGAQVPLAFLIVGVLYKYMIDLMGHMHIPKFVTPTSYIALVSLTMVVIFLRMRKEKRVDIL
ncbi:hypothetical protein SM124_06665 [Bacillus sp. 31A1R]|uniref:ABC-2 family transporter protein n=1 Tax=Robertmurraya mangrovi TaxID=3098077 RepID=A0ABU5IWB4_9BACI|nr:hypothetical protein [Bacillus sp. 31A1R]MDZ5471427.1 hypothetical protein [Bacillus sp. 31A1R]